MKVLVTGSRDWTNEDLVRQELSLIEIGVLCHGAARGLDTIAGKIATELGWLVIPYPVRVQVDGPWPAAGVSRNQRMLDDFMPDYALAFPLPQSKGTYDMIRRLIKVGVPHRIIG